MSVGFCGLELAHPIINGSGTFDAIAARATFGEALEASFPFSAFVSKTITLRPRASAGANIARATSPLPLPRSQLLKKLPMKLIETTVLAGISMPRALRICCQRSAAIRI